MATTNPSVDFVGQLTPPPLAGGGRWGTSGLMKVQLRGGATYQLDMADSRAAVWATVLDDLRRDGRPVYLEHDAATGVITNLLQPKIFSVAAVAAPKNDQVEVALHPSHGRHFVRLSNRDAPNLLASLRNAQQQASDVLVTETLSEHEIIDVRSAAGFSTGSSSNPYVAPSASAAVYPDDGCWGRAHEMVRLMLNSGLVSSPDIRKAWTFGSSGASLTVDTRNNPSCRVAWTYHVAPVIEIITGVGEETRVIDPALFTGPVLESDWFNAQNDPSADLQESVNTVFWRDRTGSTVETDPTYTKTQSVLATYRTDLMLRSASPDGPPPYAGCP